MKEQWDVLNERREFTGKTMDRGWMNPGQFHLIVNVWIKNKKGQYLIAKRVANKRWANLWGCTVGSAVAGDDSLKTALKETSEELGIHLNISNGMLIKEYINYVNSEKNCGEFIDVWLFNEDIDIRKVILEEKETCDVRWATKDEIAQMMKNKIFIPLIDLPYFEELI